MSVLTQGNYLGDWLIDEFGAPMFCREEIVVLAPSDLPSGQVLGTDSVLTTKYRPYDNSDPAAASAVLINAVDAEAQQLVTSIVDAANVATVTTPEPHNLQVGDIVRVSGATVDTDLNADRAVVAVTSNKIFTIASANVTDATYTETTLRIQKLSHAVAALKRGPAVVSKAGLDWGNSDGTGITAGLADLLVLNIVAREGV